MPHAWISSFFLPFLSLLCLFFALGLDKTNQTPSKQRGGCDAAACARPACSSGTGWRCSTSCPVHCTGSAPPCLLLEAFRRKSSGLFAFVVWGMTRGDPRAGRQRVLLCTGTACSCPAASGNPSDGCQLPAAVSPGAGRCFLAGCLPRVCSEQTRRSSSPRAPRAGGSLPHISHVVEGAKGHWGCPLVTPGLGFGLQSLCTPWVSWHCLQPPRMSRVSQPCCK